MPQIKCNIIPKPEEGSKVVFRRSDGATDLFPFIHGNGPTTYICGVCRTIIVESMYHGQVRNIVFECYTRWQIGRQMDDNA